MLGFKPVVVFATVVPCTMSLIIALIRDRASKLFGTSVTSICVADGLIFVERSSSPTTAVSTGTTIGSVSKNTPVLTRIVLCGFTSAPTLPNVPPLIATVINDFKLETSANDRVSATKSVSIICKILSLTGTLLVT